MADDGEVVFDNAEIQRILNSAAMQAEIRRVCNVIMARARVLAPVGKTSEYVNSFRVEIKTRRKLRAVGFVINDSDHAMAVEARHGVLAQARRVRG